MPVDRRLIRALALIKGGGGAGERRRCATSASTGRWPTPSPPRPTRWPTGVCDDQFPIDVFQTGSGTSSNMNANEVIATLASERLGEPARCTPTTTSTPRSPPTTSSRPPIHVAVAEAAVRRPGAGARRTSRAALRAQGRASSRTVVKSGPHPPDGRHAGHPRPGVRRLRRAGRSRRRAPRGARCPGSASCRSAAPPSAPASTPRRRSPPRVIAVLVERTGLPLTEARDHFEAQGARDGAGRGLGRAADHRGGAHQDRQRPALDGLRAPHRPGRDPPPRPAAGLVDHAGQGQPGASPRPSPRSAPR